MTAPVLPPDYDTGPEWHWWARCSAYVVSAAHRCGRWPDLGCGVWVLAPCGLLSLAIFALLAVLGR